MLVVTTEKIAGYRIEAVLGDVVGMGRAVLPSINHPALDVMYRSRDQALAGMWQQTLQRGANAVIGHRLETMSPDGRLVMACAIGTAVAVVPLGEGEPGATPQSIEDARQRAAAPQPGQQPRVGQYGQPPSGYGQPGFATG